MISLLARRRRIAAALLVAFAVAATGVPLAVPKLSSPPGERFPCENCPCGCASAKVCWNACCCHSMDERLAWAKREGVRPPEAILRLALQRGHDVSLWMESARRLTQTCIQRDADAPKSCCCCSRKQRDDQPDQQANDPVDQSPVWRTVACQGVLKFWMSVTVVIDNFGEQEVTLLPGEAVTQTRFALEPSATIPPPTPPPESLA